MSPNVKKIEETAELVLSELEKDEESRNNDNRLVYRVLLRALDDKDKSEVLRLSPRNIHRLPAFSTIIRARAVIQNRLGKYLPTSKEVRQRRRISEDQWHEYLTGTKTFPQIASDQG